jgi:hypothetical protein
MRFIRKAGAPAEKSPKRLFVEPAELARKLVKEMDDHVTARENEVWVRNRYTIYLCPEDYENLVPRAAQTVADLKAKLAKHVESMDYLVQGELTVDFMRDEELELGYFGILAQKGGSRQVVRDVAPEMAPDLAPARVAPPAAAPAPAAPLTARAAAAAEAAAVAAAKAAASQASASPQGPGRTEILPAADAAEMGLEGRVIVVTVGEKAMQFRQSRVIVGRSKEADVLVDDPNVSRKHAAIYWNNGRVMIDDLGSTNGTMVNGYPVTRTMLRPTDVVAIGESRLMVEGR